MSQMSSMEKEQTTARLLGAISTSPSASSMVSACRTGVRLNSSLSASWPSRIERRKRSQTRRRPSCSSQLRKAAPTRAPFPTPLNPSRPIAYNLTGSRFFVANLGAAGRISGLFDLREHDPAGDESALAVGQRGDPAGVGRGDRLLHLHSLEDEQHLPLLDVVALAYEDLYHRPRHRRRQAGAGRIRAARTRPV